MDDGTVAEPLAAVEDDPTELLQKARAHGPLLCLIIRHYVTADWANILPSYPDGRHRARRGRGRYPGNFGIFPPHRRKMRSGGRLGTAVALNYWTRR